MFWCQIFETICKLFQIIIIIINYSIWTLKTQKVCILLDQNNKNIQTNSTCRLSWELTSFLRPFCNDTLSNTHDSVKSLSNMKLPAYIGLEIIVLFLFIQHTALFSLPLGGSKSILHPSCKSKQSELVKLYWLQRLQSALQNTCVHSQEIIHAQ